MQNAELYISRINKHLERSSSFTHEAGKECVNRGDTYLIFGVQHPKARDIVVQLHLVS